MRIETLEGVLLHEDSELTTADICSACSQQTQWVYALVAEGVLEPSSGEHEDWRFPIANLQRARRAMRLERDLGINLAGVALALNLLDELELLKARLDKAQIGS